MCNQTKPKRKASKCFNDEQKSRTQGAQSIKKNLIDSRFFRFKY